MSICNGSCPAKGEIRYISYRRMGPMTLRRNRQKEDLILSKLPIDPGITDVVKAYRFLRNRVRHTPTEYSFPLSEICGAPVYIKWENQQLCGSFKLRGALYKMNSLSHEERAK